MFTPAKDAAPLLPPPPPGHYVLYGWQWSYFTRKLDAALRFYGASFELRRKDPAHAEEIRVRSGTHQVPVLHTPENWMLGDTTPILALLDGRFPARALVPPGLLGVLVHALEEYFDEWIARTTVHWRWAYEENHAPLSLDAMGGDATAAAKLVDWGRRVCRATGVSSDVQKAAAEAEYLRILDAAEAQLAETRYLLGDRPTAVDCIVLGGLRAHFLHDPAPRRELLPRYPRVVAWAGDEESDAAPLADAWDGEGALAPFPESTPFARTILAEMAGSYAPFAAGNRDARAAKQKAFVIPMYGEDVSYLARGYVERSRQMVARRVAALGADERATARGWLGAAGLADVFS
ncbi:MAG: glutathione S-transferase family protein [Myxococcota bacterium]